MFLLKLNENFLNFEITTKSKRIPFCGGVYEYVQIHLVNLLHLLFFECGVTTKMIAMEAKNPKHVAISAV